MKKIILLKGLPASGKSTWAKEQLKDSNWVRINKDDLRAMINNSHWSRENEKIILHIRDNMIKTFCTLGKNIIIDDTNFAPKHQYDVERILLDLERDLEIEYKLKIKFIDTSLDECIRRDSLRKSKVGEKVIRDMNDRYLKPN